MQRLTLGPILMAMMVVAAATGLGQEARYTPEELQIHFQNEAEAYVMQRGDVRLELRKSPLMNWQNPERNHELGATYVWQKDGVPRVLASIFTFEYNNVVRCRHEMISLADGAFDCTLHSETVWTPKRPGLSWKPIPDVAAPAASAARRLFQMRTIARQFSGSVLYAGKPPNHLQLIPQPLIRYQSPDQGIIDAAIFSLAVVTDPEILIVIQADRDKDGTSSFKFAPIRANYHALELNRNGVKVWEAPLVIELQQTRAAQRPWANDPFFVFTPTQPLPLSGTIK